MLKTTAIGVRLGAGFTLVVLVLGAVVAVAIHEGGQLNQRLEDLLAKQYRKTVSANLMIDRANDISRTMGETLLAANVDFRQHQYAVIRARQQAAEQFAWLRQHETSTTGNRLLDKVGQVRVTYTTAQERFFQLLESGDRDRDRARERYRLEIIALQDQYVDAVARMIQYQDATMRRDADATRQRVQQASWLLLAMSLCAILLAAAISFRITRSITRPLAAAVRVANSVASGSLDVSPGRPQCDETGQLTRALTVMARNLAEDRTKRETTEQALRDNERLYRLLAEHSSDMICLQSPDGRYTYVSPACVALLGRTQDELVGQSPLALVEPGDLPGVLAAHVDLCNLAANASHTLTFRVRHYDGTHRWVEVSRRRICDPDAGATTEIVSVMRDITTRHAAEQRFHENAELLARSQRQAQLGSWWLDLRSQRLAWSDETYRIHGIAVDTPLEYGTFLDAAHPDDRDYVARSWSATVAGAPYDIEHRIVVAGDIRWVRQRASMEYDNDGHPIRALGSVQDITALKLKEAELLHSRQMLRELAAHREHAREQERSHIAREIHDDLGQYLTALRLDVAMLPLRFGHHDPGIARHADTMKQTIDLTMEVVREVAAALRPAILDEGLLPAMEWLLGGFSKRSGVATRLDAPPHDIALDGMLATTAFRILQESLTNVTRHAQATKVVVTIDCGSGALRLQVSDNGLGFVHDDAIPRKTFGLLGMHERALMFGGTVSIRSAPHQGTTVLAVLPILDHGPT